MARDYRTSRSSNEKSNKPRQLLVLVFAFCLGYGMASLFDIDTISHWLQTQVLAQHKAPEKSINKPVQQAKKQIPKPKFEFYTLLTNERVQGTGAKPAEKTVLNPKTAASTNRPPVVEKVQPKSPQIVEAKPVPAAPPSPAVNYVVQVAAFRAQKDADNLKALLLLKGYEVSVVSIHNQKGQWYRVLVGPYQNKVKAQAAQTQLAKAQHLNGMITQTS